MPPAMPARRPSTTWAEVAANGPLSARPARGYTLGMKAVLTVLLILLLGLQYALWLGEGSLPGLWQLQREVASQRQQNEALAERNRLLAAEVQALKQGGQAVEERARSELGMIKPGEVFYQVIEQ